MPFRPRELEQILLRKFDFSYAENRSDDHIWFELELPGLPVISTYISHGNTPIDKSLEGIIAKQLRVRTQYFRGMRDCHNSREDYYRQVRENPYPPWDVRF